jgi:diaminohydroxyphosphoribosylaminopyrimidine deaminase/5-amino-6-(5-phosphoribosylamino)uracil reductase
MSKNLDQEDHIYMQMVIELAEKGKGYVNPNPLVGAIIVQDDKVIGKGFHQKYGETHAEINALNNIYEPLVNATLYVNLEPCSHQGQTASCAKEIIRHNFKRVVIANIDPNPLVAGKGIEILKSAGIKVDLGILEEKARIINKVFFKYIKTKQPYVMLKSAMSLDGKIATHTGESKWISCEESRKLVHQYRHQYSAILTGVNSIIADNSLLNTRLDIKHPSHPVRIILDPSAKIPLKSKILNSPEFGKVIIVTTDIADLKAIELLKSKGVEIVNSKTIDGNINLKELMNTLGKDGIDSIMVEAGGNTNFECIKQNIVDEIKVFVSPQIIGGVNALTPFEGIGFKSLPETKKINNIKYSTINRDLLIEAEL